MLSRAQAQTAEKCIGVDAATVPNGEVLDETCYLLGTVALPSVLEIHNSHALTIPEEVGEVTVVLGEDDGGYQRVQFHSAERARAEGFTRQAGHDNHRPLRIQIRADRFRCETRRVLGQQMQRLPLPFGFGPSPPLESLGHRVPTADDVVSHERDRLSSLGHAGQYGTGFTGELAARQAPDRSPMRRESSIRWAAWLAGCLAAGEDRRMRAGAELRRGTVADAGIAADLYLRARRRAVPAIPPLVHSEDEVRQWLQRVLREQEVWLAFTDDGTLLGLMVLQDDWIEQLYADPDWTGRGLGTQFLELAKRRRPSGLQLWTFVSNARARRFYERNGFVAEECTDGSGNEEHAPDLRYAWRPPAPAAADPGS